ncbi:MAG: DNA polymerase V [Oleiphilaceae bacterium]|jgi:DNA polymerase V
MIALCDMEKFYASVELIFRPDIINRRVAVLSNNDGCVVACTREAMAVGVEKFMPYFQQKELIKRECVTVFSSNYTLYGLVSQRIMAILTEEAPLTEVYSIDEAFLDVTGIPNLPSFGAHLRARVWKEQRIPMGVGIAPSKTLSKLANKASKFYGQLQGVCILDEAHKWEWLIQRVHLTDVWGIAKGMEKRLAGNNVKSAHELSLLSQSQARNIGGVVLARTVNELNGIPSIEFETSVANKQQIVSSKSFGTKTQDKSVLKRAVSMYAMRASEKLRKQHSVTGLMSVWIQTARYDPRQAYFCPVMHWAFDPPTDDSRFLSSIAASLVDTLYRSNLHYAKVGVSLSKIREKGVEQGDLFSSVKKDDSLNEVMDSINHRYGRSTVRPARQAGDNQLMKREFLSPNYLTQWSDIPIVRC